jgi:hypothetical protein
LTNSAVSRRRRHDDADIRNASLANLNATAQATWARCPQWVLVLCSRSTSQVHFS